MTRAQFLNNLYRRLTGSGMDAEQAEQHLTYYAEMLADRMEEGMDEDAAVAGMEDVDTIARRILEEEGLPYRPPAYPDPPGPGGGGKRAYRAPKRMKPAQIALWAVAILCALGAVGRWVFLGMNVWPGPGRGYNTAASEGVSVAVDHATPIPEVMEGYAPLNEAYAWEVAYEYGYSYSGGMTSTPAASLEKLDIQWAAGMVYVQSWNGDEIQIQEYSHSELTGRNSMVVEEGETPDGAQMSIRYRDGASLGTVKGDKWLTVLVPDGMVDTLTIETTSADVWLLGLEQGEVDVSTSSGGVDLSECYFQRARIDTISGRVNFAGIYTDVLGIFTTSGDVNGDAHCADAEVKTISGDVDLITQESTERIKASTTSGDVWLNISNPAMESINVDTTSGHVSLIIPYDMGVSVKYSTVSGMFNSSWMDADRSNGVIVYNGGGCEIEVDTVSGHLDIY